MPVGLTANGLVEHLFDVFTSGRTKLSALARVGLVSATVVVIACTSGASDKGRDSKNCLIREDPVIEIPKDELTLENARTNKWAYGQAFLNDVIESDGCKINFRRTRVVYDSTGERAEDFFNKRVEQNPLNEKFKLELAEHRENMKVYKSPENNGVSRHLEQVVFSDEGKPILFFYGFPPLYRTKADIMFVLSHAQCHSEVQQFIDPKKLLATLGVDKDKERVSDFLGSREMLEVHCYSVQLGQTASTEKNFGLISPILYNGILEEFQTNYDISEMRARKEGLEYVMQRMQKREIILNPNSIKSRPEN